jgi:hypothetical protein
MEMITFCQPRLEYQTSGIDKAQWFDMFTPVEQIKLSELKTRLEDFSFMQVQLDAPTEVDGYATTYRAVMRAFFAAWDSAPSISVKHPMLYSSLGMLEMLGILDDETRKDTLILGVPL